MIDDNQHSLQNGCDIENDTFSGLSLIGTDLRNAKLIDCVFDGCALSSVKIDGATLHCEFTNSKIEGINFFTAKRSMLQLKFSNCLIRHSSFAELKLPAIDFSGSTLINVDFADADLNKAIFGNCTFEECTFKNTNLTKANFEGARGYMLDPTLNRVRGAKFDVPEVLALLAPFGIVIE